MKWINPIAAVMLLAAIFVSCEKPSGNDAPAKEKAPELKVTPAEPAAIPSAGGTLTLSLMTNRDWTVSGAPQWLTVSPASGKKSNYKQEIILTAAENTEGMREAVLKFEIDGLSQEVKVVQNHSFGSDAPAETLFFESFETTMGSFTIQDVTVPEQIGFVWEFSSQYKCMKATAFANPANYASESWLISPEVNLTNVSKSYLTFEHAGGYFGKATEEATVWVSKDGGDWQQLIIDPKDYPTNWAFISAGVWDLSDYAGGKIRIGFKYCSTATKAGTWEVRNVSVQSGTYEEVVIPSIDPKQTQWLELPAMDNENYGYYSHSFKMKDKVYRNYSFAWSQKDLVSAWIAYPLGGVYTDKVVDRTDEWAYDPILGKENSSAPFSYYAGDYARGHQLPSADRLCCREANEQTFYGSNIVPQLNEHNEGIWSNLENRIRNVADASDTTYVVTGCILEGATEFSEDSDKKTITIPVAFFKAALRYEKDSKDAVWTAAGFYTEHKNYTNKDLKAVSMSIDELEEKTGLDFFVNLAGKIGEDQAAAIEAQDPSTFAVWGL